MSQVKGHSSEQGRQNSLPLRADMLMEEMVSK